VKIQNLRATIFTQKNLTFAFFLIFAPTANRNYPKTMFLAIILTIIALSVGVEWAIVHNYLKNHPQRAKRRYVTLATLCIAPYALWLIVGRIWDMFSPIAEAIGNILITLLLFNFMWKSLWLIGKLLSQATSRRWPSVLTLTLSLLLTILAVTGATTGRTTLRTTHIELHYPNLPAAADGLRIVQIGDLHIGLSPSHRALLRKVVHQIYALHPDIIIDCGDMVNSRHTELDSLTMNILDDISAPLGVYTTTGNHDNGSYILDTLSLPADESHRLLMEKQASMGWQNITDRHVAIPLGGDTIYISAIDYPASLRKGSHGVKPTEEYTDFFATLPTEAFNIVISHTPTAWDNILAATSAELS
jgi:predicted MPP superfamily phosphohydrolase